MRLALDTNRYTDFCRGEPQTVAVLESAEEIHLPFVVLGELRAGFSVGKYGSENERVLRELLMRAGVYSLMADEQTTYHYAAVYRQLRRQGTPIPTNDMWTAALVIQHNLVLCHRDQHFDNLPQIACV
jgi:tRNA(fMet)-specific endonuclease VapC